MTMRITITEACRSENGLSILTVGQTVTVSRGFGAQLVQQQRATNTDGVVIFPTSGRALRGAPATPGASTAGLAAGTHLIDPATGLVWGQADGVGGRAQPTPELQALVSVDGRLSTAATSAAAASNVAILNAVLALRGVVSLRTPGQYLFGGAGQGGLLIPSNTTIVCGEGVEMIVADQTLQPLIRNASAFAAGITLAGAITWTGPKFRVYAASSGIHLVHPVGSWIAVLGLQPSNSSNRGYQGVYKVRLADDTGGGRIGFDLLTQPPSGGNSAAGAIIYPADNNIKIIGGMWDGNETGQAGSGYNDGDPRQFINGFRNCVDILVQGADYRKGESWCVGTNNVRSARFLDLKADLGIDGASLAHVIVQLAGGSRDVLIDGVTGSATDNLVAHSLDALSGTVTYPNYWPGDSYNTVIKNVHSDHCSAPIVALWGNTNSRHHDVVIEGVTGRSESGAVHMFGGYAPTDMLNVNGGNLAIRGISGNFGDSPVHIKSDGAWDQVVIDNIRNDSTSTASAVIHVSRQTTTQTIRRLDITNIFAATNTNNSRAGPLIEIRDTNINDLSIEKLPGVILDAGVSMVQFAGTVGIVNRAQVEKVSGSTAANGDQFLVSCENTLAGAVGRLAIRDASFTGNGSNGGVFRQATTGRVTTVILDNCDAASAEGVSVLDNGANPATVTTRAG